MPHLTKSAQQRADSIAEARRIIDLAERHQIALEFTADGWRLVPVDLAAVVAVAPMADELTLVVA